MKKQLTILSVILLFLINTSLIIDYDRILIIDTKTKYYKFIREDEDNFTKVIIQGGLINSKGDFSFTSDSIFNRLNENIGLTELEIHSCNMREIPDRLCENKNLVLLSLSVNRIETNNCHLKRLKKLRYLNLEYNEIRSIGPFIKSFKHLAELAALNFSNNKIDSIPTEVCNLKNLKNLYLANNMIKFLPCCISNMESFQLNVGFNPIKEIPCCYNRKYATWFELNIDNKIILPDCFKDSTIPINNRIQID